MDIYKEIKRTSAMAESMYYQAKELKNAILKDKAETNSDENSELYFEFCALCEDMKKYNEEINDLYLKVIKK